MSSIFDKIIPGKGEDKKKKKKEEEKKKSSKKEKASKTKKKKSSSKPKKKKSKISAEGFSKTSNLVQPWITEKAREMEAQGKYTFRVKPEANKSEVKKEVQQRYDVTVTKVNISNTLKRPKQFRGIQGKREHVKKAIVTLKEGDKIEIFPV